MREITKKVNISNELLFNILHERLGMKKLLGRWVPRLLTVDQKQTRVTISKVRVNKFERNSSKFLRRYFTVDETLIQYYTPEMKQKSKQWTSSNEHA